MVGAHRVVGIVSGLDIFALCFSVFTLGVAIGQALMVRSANHRRETAEQCRLTAERHWQYFAHVYNVHNTNDIAGRQR